MRNAEASRINATLQTPAFLNEVLDLEAAQGVSACDPTNRGGRHRSRGKGLAQADKPVGQRFRSDPADCLLHEFVNRTPSFAARSTTLSGISTVKVMLEVYSQAFR